MRSDNQSNKLAPMVGIGTYGELMKLDSLLAKPNDPGPEYIRACHFACISMFDTGTVDLDTTYFREVFALSSSGSLYVSDMVLSDLSLYWKGHTPA